MRLRTWEKSVDENFQIFSSVIETIFIKIPIMQFTYSLVAGIIFLLLVISIGIGLYRSGRYPIFYFALCGLFIVSAMVMLGGIGVSMASDTLTNDTSEESRFSFLTFSYITTTGIYFMLALLSVANLFIRTNKVSVKIVSGIMIAVCLFLGIAVYALSNFAG